MHDVTLRAYRAWRKAAERGYGNKDQTKEHMDKVDSNIRRLKAAYDILATRSPA